MRDPAPENGRRPAPDDEHSSATDGALFIAGFAIFVTAVVAFLLVTQPTMRSASQSVSSRGVLPTATIPAGFAQSPIEDLGARQPLAGGAEAPGDEPEGGIPVAPARVAPPTNATPTFEETAEMMNIGSLIILQYALLQQGAFETLYATLSPTARDACPYERFTDALRDRPQQLAAAQLAGIAIRIDGDRAYATYSIVRGGETIDRATDTEPDIYERIGGAWYDAADPHLDC